MVSGLITKTAPAINNAKLELAGAGTVGAFIPDRGSPAEFARRTGYVPLAARAFAIEDFRYNPDLGKGPGQIVDFSYQTGERVFARRAVQRIQ